MQTKKRSKRGKGKSKKESTRKRKTSFGSKNAMEKFLKKRKDSPRSDIDFEIKGKENNPINSIELESDLETTELVSDVEMLEVDPESKIALENLINNISLNNSSAKCQGYKPIVGNISHELSIYSLTNLDIIIENNSLHCKECCDRNYTLTDIMLSSNKFCSDLKYSPKLNVIVQCECSTPFLVFVQMKF